MTDLVILNEDALRRTHPVFAQAGAGANCIFIWDMTYFEAMQCGLKRQVFLYETLCEMDVEIYGGVFADVFPQLLAQYAPSTVFVPYSVNPKLKDRHALMAQNCDTHIVKDEVFIVADELPDLRRFFRYWNKARKFAFSYNGIGS